MSSDTDEVSAEIPADPPAAVPAPSPPPALGPDDTAEPVPPSTRLPRGLTVLLGAAGAFVVASGLRAANEFVAPVLVALVLTIAVGPIRRWALRHRWPSWAATLLSLVGAYLIVLFLVVSVAVAIVQLAAMVPTYTPRAQELVTELQQHLTDAGLSQGSTSDALSQLDLGKVASVLTTLLSSLLGILSGLFFLVTVLFFLVADAAGAGRRAALLRRTNPDIEASLGHYVRAIEQYLIVTTLFGGIVAVFDTLALWWIGVPLPLLWGLLAFVTNFIPNIGFIIGVVPPALLALLDSGWQEMVLVLVVYSVLNVTIQTFIQPHFVGDAVGLSTSATFLSLGIWTFVLGPLGALLAVPATLLVRAILVDPDPRAGWAYAFIGSTPPPPTPPPPTPPAKAQPAT